VKAFRAGVRRELNREGVEEVNGEQSFGPSPISPIPNCSRKNKLPSRVAFIYERSDTRSLPCFASRRMLAAVNCFEIEPTSKTVCGVIDTFSSRFASPYPLL
jgi:hypothetical protein